MNWRFFCSVNIMLKDLSTFYSRLESGIIYPAAMIIYMAVSSPPEGKLPSVDLYPMVVLAAVCIIA